jgi:hypothetical protein
MLKPPGTKRLKLLCDVLLSIFAFKFNLRRYNKAAACEAWHRACNPDDNPIECWHWCHWDALQRTPGRVGRADKGGTGGKGGEVGGGWQAGPH